MSVARTTSRARSAAQQLLALEALDPRPQPGERVLGLLRLHPGEPLAPPRPRRDRLAREQQLARERRAVELRAA